MSARMPRLTYCEAYQLVLQGNMVLRTSEIRQDAGQFSFRARVAPNTQPLTSFEITMTITPQEYKNAELPPCFGSASPFYTTTREES